MWLLYHVMHKDMTWTQRYRTEQCSYVVAIFMLNKCHPITWKLCVKYYYMVAASVSDHPAVENQFLGVDVTGPWRFLCSKDRFDWGMASHACVSLWVLEFYFPTVYWSTYPQETDKHISPVRIGSISMTLIEWTFLTQWPAVVLFSSATPDSKTELL